MLDARGQAALEKVTQTYFKEMADWVWAIVGVTFTLSAVIGGIYFSQVSFSYFLGNDNQLMIAISYGLAVMISALEVVGLKLLDNRGRSLDIKNNSKTEYNVMNFVTRALFVFDILSNIYGVYTTVYAIWGKVTISAWVFIIIISALMGLSEVIFGWILRGLAVSYVQYNIAKRNYDDFQERLEKMSTDNSYDREDDVMRPMNKNNSNYRSISSDLVVQGSRNK